MRKGRIEEDILKDEPVVADAKAICSLCGTPLEKDDESGEYRCPVCDADEVR